MTARLKQEHRRALAIASVLGGWAGALVVTILRVTEKAGASYGALAILFIGIAIAGHTTLSRMRAVEAMTQVFVAGLTAGSAAAAGKKEVS
ncbi:hypothetical protein ACGFZA_16080 [Streptomyces sp. NPDC048211]|uniref:hypothetical protein n=1 Tax=Streptomyces sp. NPDC048211 TaxID=3365516 RepID=UPI0037200B9B